MALRWKKADKPTGLAAVGAGPYRSSRLRDEEEEYASCYPYGGTWREEFKGWYFTVPSNAQKGIPHYNSYSEGQLFAEEKEAKAAAVAYVKKYLNA